MRTVRIDLPILLPDIPDARDACVERLQSLLNQRRGVAQTPVVDDGAAARLCVHYNPAVLTLHNVEELAKAAGAEVAERYGHRVWPLRAVTSEDVGGRIEETVRQIPGVVAAAANLPAQAVRVEFERGRFRPDAVDDALRTLGFAAAAAPEGRASWYSRHRELVWSLAAGAFLAAGVAANRVGAAPSLVTAIYVGSYIFGAFDLVNHALGTIRRGRLAFDIDLLMLLAALGAALLGARAEGAFLLFLFSLAHALEHYALGRARASIRALADLAPAIARVQRRPN